MKIGLYRHFKGDYYFVQNIVIDTITGKKSAYYFNIFEPEKGFFVRPCEEWFDNVEDRKDNVTGQVTRFTPIRSIDNPAENLTTPMLMRVLAERSDSPLQKLDIEGLNSRVVATDYVIGEYFEPSEENPYGGIYTQNVFDDLLDMNKHLEHYVLHKGQKRYKRTFIEVD